MTDGYVLVVDDERVVRELLVRSLKSLGFAAIAVQTPGEALDAIESLEPIAVIVDFVMPLRDGLWLLEQVRGRWPGLPVIMASGASLGEDALIRARQLGASDFIAKPFGREMLLQAINRAVSN